MLIMIVSNTRTDPFVGTDSQKTEECPELIHCDTVASKNTEKINQQIYNTPYVQLSDINSTHTPL